MPHDVFISYASVNKPVADSICHNLESKQIRCWMAPRDILPGQDYAQALNEAIHKSTIFILVFSEMTNNSRHVMSEVQLAFNNKCIIIPFKIEDISPSKALEYYIGRSHWLDAVTPPLEEKIEKLGATVQTFLKGESSPRKEYPDTPDSTSTVPPVPPHSQNAKRILALTGIVIVIAAVFLIPPLFRNISAQSAGELPPLNSNPIQTTPPVTAPGIVNVTGIWTATLHEGSMDLDATLDITQTGNDVSGKFKLVYVKLPQFYVEWIVAGNIVGDELSLRYVQPITRKPVTGFTMLNYQELQFWFDLKNSPPGMLAGRWADGYYTGHGYITLTR